MLILSAPSPTAVVRDAYDGDSLVPSSAVSKVEDRVGA